MAQLTGSLVKYPARASIIWYLGMIAAGTFALYSPICHADASRPLSLLDSAFTATSATCVTGLVVRSTQHDLSWIGQLAVLSLIQLGGVGIMTITTFVMFRLGGEQGLRHRVIVSETLGAHQEADLRWVLQNVLLITVIVESVGVVLLTVRGLVDQAPLIALWQAIFHSVSAFCNAGFALHDDSLTAYQGDPLVNGTICLLIVTGGLGFPVLLDLRRNFHGPWPDRWNGLHLHSKLMLIGTVVLLLGGTTAFLSLEWDGSLRDMSLGRKLLVASFHSVSARTAGFNTISIGSLTNATLFVLILLMAIGAGPCSTGGGLKVSTIAVLACRAWTTFRGYKRVNVFRRTIPPTCVDRAIATTMLFGVSAMVALTTLLVFEQSEQAHSQSPGPFLDAVFEVVSALGTVGLSTGLTSWLTDAGKVIITVLMFAGRLGPITVFIAVSSGERRQPFEFPHEEPMIG